MNGSALLDQALDQLAQHNIEAALLLLDQAGQAYDAEGSPEDKEVTDFLIQDIKTHG